MFGPLFLVCQLPAGSDLADQRADPPTALPHPPRTVARLAPSTALPRPPISTSIILSLLLAIGTLLSATLYLTSRRHTLVPCHRQAFDEVAWDVYSPKLARGISVSRRLDRQAAREAREGGAGGGRRAEAEKKRRAQNEVREAVAAQAAEAALAGAEGRPEMGERKETVVDFAALPQLKREPSVKRIPKVGSVGIIRQDSAIAMAPLQEEKELVEL